MAATYSYNGNEITLDYAGQLIEGGYADGEFFRLEMESDDIVDAAGTGGDVVVAPTNDKRANAFIILHQAADGNDVLSAIRQAGQRTPIGFAAAPLYVRDRLGRSVFEGLAILARPPDAAFAREAGSREWKLRITQISRFDGGNVRLD